jgi:hypothetical protein
MGARVADVGGRVVPQGHLAAARRGAVPAQDPVQRASLLNPVPDDKALYELKYELDKPAPTGCASRLPLPDLMALA